MKKCELCNSPANIYCESDQAILCSNCDSIVHAANFLVAKHSRTLLCHVCHSLTPWIGSGPKFGPTISVCENCVTKQRSYEEEEGDNDEDFDTENETDNDGNEDDEENQVVPLSSSSVSEESCNRFCRNNF